MLLLQPLEVLHHEAPVQPVGRVQLLARGLARVQIIHPAHEPVLDGVDARLGDVFVLPVVQPLLKAHVQSLRHSGVRLETTGER